VTVCPEPTLDGLPRADTGRSAQSRQWRRSLGRVIGCHGSQPARRHSESRGSFRAFRARRNRFERPPFNNLDMDARDGGSAPGQSDSEHFRVARLLPRRFPPLRVSSESAGRFLRATGALRDSERPAMGPSSSRSDPGSSFRVVCQYCYMRRVRARVSAFMRVLCHGSAPAAALIGCTRLQPPPPSRRRRRADSRD
jgi:hypothetical protein